MKLSENPDALTKFRRTAWKFQQTFQTPLKNLQPFVSTIVKAGEQWKAGVSPLNKWYLIPEI